MSLLVKIKYFLSHQKIFFVFSPILTIFKDVDIISCVDLRYEGTLLLDLEMGLEGELLLAELRGLGLLFESGHDISGSSLTGGH